MTEISEAAKAKALELCNALRPPGMHYEHRDFNRKAGPIWELARFIQQVSDAAKLAREYGVDEGAWDALAPFILPEPVDPLRAALREIPDEDIRSISATYDVGACRERIADALAKRGLKIVEATDAKG